WGRVRSLQDAALESYLASDAARRAASIALVAQVVNGYLTLREFDERIALAQQTIASRAESFRIFTRRVEVGSTSRLNL
ncbi:MAG: TolC family protein, partial [Rhodospirillaceae bacterium]|nr:TolC family protein [Rhodospirillaceae bacterium]